MRNLFHSKFFTLAASAIFACIAFPGLASADICNKIDYTFPSKLMDQVKLYAQNSSVDANDAACVLRRISFPSHQEEVGIYLSGVIVDPENIDVMINAVTFPSTKEAITKAALANPRRNNHHYGHGPAGHPGNHHPMPAPAQHHPMPAPAQHHPMPAPANHYPAPAPANHYPAPAQRPGNHYPAPSHQYVQPAPNNHHPSYRPMPQQHRNIVQNVNQKIDYSFSSKIMDQVKLYVGNSYIYASDAAEIIRKSNFPSTQKEIGAYLCPRIADRENLDAFINAPDFPSVRESLVQSCMN